MVGGALVRGAPNIDVDHQTARVLLTPACQRRHRSSCFALAELELLQERFEPAASTFAIACELGELGACHNQALALSKLDRDGQEPLLRSLYQKACPAVPNSCGLLAGLIKTENPSEAGRLATQGCDGKDAYSCWYLGWAHSEADAGVVQDLVAARAFHQKGCELGDETACNSLGVLLESGRGGSVDLEGAVRLYEKACTTTNEPYACTNLAEKLREGSGIARDEPRAAHLLDQTCAHGHTRGCHAVMNALPRNGTSIEWMNGRRAIFAAGCDAGATSGCLYWGSVLEHTDKNLSAAASLYERACEGGEPDGCAWHADLLYDGRGVTKDLAKAQAQYDKACTLGNARSCHREAGSR